MYKRQGQLLALYRANARPAYGYGNPEVVLDDLPSSAWSLLRSIRAAGATLVPVSYTNLDVYKRQ